MLLSGMDKARMHSVALYVPQKEISAWVTETDPKQARAWLAGLPLADGGDSARDIYQALYALNRLDIAPHTRLELMELYREPVATACSILEAEFIGRPLPLSVESRQLAEFIRRLQMEMAIGYKCAIQDLQAGGRLPWGRRNQLALASQRAMWHLGAVLLRSYLVYMPQPAGVWAEIHTLYRFAEEQGHLTQSVELPGGRQTTLSHGYRQILLLALCNPYQLSQGECIHVDAFLDVWVDKATIDDSPKGTDPAGQFLVDLGADAPPMLLAQQRRASGVSPALRILNTIELARVVHGFIKRLEQGESAEFLKLPGELSNTSCREMLRRMIKFWGLTPTRKYPRTKTRGYLSVCAGINALHFFGGGRRPFVPPEEPSLAAAESTDSGSGGEGEATAGSSAVEGTPARQSGLPRWLAAAKLSIPEVFPVDRWQLRDESARGLLLAHEGDVAVNVRVGDVIGMQSTGGDWHAGVIRWVKSPEAKRVEMGVERLAPKVTPAAVRPLVEGSGAAPRYAQALMLPAMPVLQRPATLLIPRGMFEPGRDLELAGEAGNRRVVRGLKLVERTASFDQVVFAEVSAR
jgi:hypothetical protein